MPRARHLRLVVEDPSEVVAVREDLGLEGQERPARVHEVQARQVVLRGDLLRAKVLLHRQGEVRAAFDGRVVRDDHALAALDDADARDHARARGLSPRTCPCGERAQFEERRVGIDQPLDPLARGQLAALAVPGECPLAAALRDERGAPAQLRHELRHPLVPRGEGVVALRLRREDAHVLSLSPRAVDSRSRAASSSVSCPRRRRQRQLPVARPGCSSAPRCRARARPAPARSTAPRGAVRKLDQAPVRLARIERRRVPLTLRQRVEPAARGIRVVRRRVDDGLSTWLSSACGFCARRRTPTGGRRCRVTRAACAIARPPA